MAVVKKSQTQVESELIRYYDAEAERRAALSTEGQRAAGRERALARVLPSPPARLLDLGPGPGRDSRAFGDTGYDVVGLDLSLENAKACAGLGIEALTGSAVHLPFCSEAFDAVWSMSVLMHVTQGAIEEALGEIARVLQPGGVAVIGSWGGPDQSEQLASSRVEVDRNFSRRSDPVWKRMLSEHIGEIEYYETWPHPTGGDWFYQWAEVRRC